MKKSICFIGLDNYPIMNPEYKTTYIGGESVQQSLIAKAFAKLGWEVSMIVKDHGQQDGEIIDGVRILKAYRPDSGMPVLRFIHPKVTSVWKCLVKANADIYYHSCAGFITGLAAHYCQQNDRRLVFRLAHDSDCIPGQQIIPNIRDRKLYEYGLRRADVIYAQSDVQMRLLSDNYGLESTNMPMAVQPPSFNESEVRDIDVLWVNNIRQFKRPDLYLELAKQFPDFRFVMIGGPTPAMPEYFDEIKKEAGLISNLDFMGFVPYSEVNGYFSRSRVFVNTSDSEGFPNSFLQAWIRGVPVISFFDPGGTIKGQGLGAVPVDLQDMCAALDRLLASTADCSSLSRHVQDYAMQNHAPESVAMKYVESFSRMLGIQGEGAV